jgi:hypothetical protein
MGGSTVTMPLGPLVRAAQAGKVNISARDLVRAAGGRASLARMLAARRESAPSQTKQHLHDVLRVERVVFQHMPLRISSRRALDRLSRAEGMYEWGDSQELVRHAVTRMVFDLAGESGTEEKRKQAPAGDKSGGLGRPSQGGRRSPSGETGRGGGRRGTRS